MNQRYIADIDTRDGRHHSVTFAGPTDGESFTAASVRIIKGVTGSMDNIRHAEIAAISGKTIMSLR